MELSFTQNLPLLIRGLISKNSQCTPLTRCSFYPSSVKSCPYPVLCKNRNLSTGYKTVHIEPPQQEYVFRKELNVKGRSLINSPNMRRSKYGQAMSREFIKTLYKTKLDFPKENFTITRLVSNKNSIRKYMRSRNKSKALEKALTTHNHKNFSIEIKCRHVNVL